MREASEELTPDEIMHFLSRASSKAAISLMGSLLADQQEQMKEMMLMLSVLLIESNEKNLEASLNLWTNVTENEKI